MRGIAEKRISLVQELNQLDKCCEALLLSDLENLNTNLSYKNYARQLARIGFAAGDEGLQGLQDLCVHLYANFKHLLEIGSVDSARFSQALSAWEKAVRQFIENPQDTDAIVKIVRVCQKDAWPTHLEDYEVELIIKQLAQNDEHIEQINRQLNGQPEADMQPVADEQSSLANLLGEELEHIIGEFTQSCVNKRCDTQNIKSLIENLGLYAVSVSTNGFVGLLDIIQIVRAELQDALSNDEAMQAAVFDYVSNVNNAIIHYLHNVQETPATRELVKVVTHSDWSQNNYEADVPSISLMLCPTYQEEITEEDIEAENEIEAELQTENSQDEVIKDEIEVEPDVEITAPEQASSENQAHSSEARQVPPQYTELAELIGLEFVTETTKLIQHMHGLAEGEPGRDSHEAGIRAYPEFLQRFISVIQSIGLDGLASVLNDLGEIPNAIIGDEAIPSNELPEWFEKWGSLISEYIMEPYAEQPVLQLVSHYDQDNLPVALSGFRDESLADKLHDTNIVVEDDTPDRPTQAEPDDVSLALPADVNQQLLESLLQELPHHTEQFSDAIHALVSGKTGMDGVANAQRIAHTLKGSANTVGIKGVANLTHHIEDILAAYSRHEQVPGQQLLQHLVDASDVLEMMCEYLLGTNPSEPEESVTVLQSILDIANSIDQQGIEAEIPEKEQYSKTETVAEPEKEPASEYTKTADAPRVSVEAQSSIRIPASLADDMLRLAGESIILTGQLKETLKNAASQNQSMREHGDLLQQLVIELEKITDIHGVANKVYSKANGMDFDALEFDEFNELHTITRRLVEAAADSKAMAFNLDDQLKNLDTLFSEQTRLQKENQDVVLQTRMVPVKSVIARLQRGIRQACRHTGKQAELDVLGGETMMDSSILHELVEPLMHLIRNAVDHGIEEPEQRQNHNKTPHGNIQLRFDRQGNQIVIQCQDDGRGLDYEKIRQEAIRLGIYPADEEISEDKLQRCLFIGGFTTRKNITQVSGRGIGMEAVYKNIIDMNGIIRLSSELGKGTKIEISLPLTLISIHGLVIQASNQTIVLSTRGIEQILYQDSGEPIFDDDHMFYEIDEMRYPASYIENILGQPIDRARLQEQSRPVLIVEEESGEKRALFVDRIVSTQDLVVKKLSDFVPEINGIDGVTILGDGRVAPVVDLPKLLRHSNKQHSLDFIPDNIAGIESSAPKVLIVDDSLSTRNSLSQFISDVGYEVLLARDGIDALERIEETKPDIMLVDMEMPRMNGLELTNHIRSNSETRSIPVIMITSRSTVKHKDEARKAGVDVYLTKPYSEEELIEHVESRLAQV
mgnify:CR=1 FL=1